MIVPSIDLMNGNAVQLIGGKEKCIDAGDPMPIAERFAVAGDLAVIDLDAAMSTGINNEDTIRKLTRRYACRVGGGIRSVDAAIRWLDAGAERIILGTKAVPEILSQLPKSRLMAAVDADHGEVVVEGWKSRTGDKMTDRLRELRDYVDGFLVTFVEREGRLQGLDFNTVKEVIEAAGNTKVTIAGGVTTTEDICQLDALGADAQVGMALYSGRMDLGQAVAAPLKSDRADGLIPTIVADEHGVSLGLCYSSRESIAEAINSRTGVYYSRSRGGLWHKGATSGNRQELLKVRADCDRDALLFTVRQSGAGFCHLSTRSCFGDIAGNHADLGALERLVNERRLLAPEGSYTARLFGDLQLLGAKLREEASELTEAENPAEVCWEAADVIYFTLVRMAASGVRLSDVEEELSLRSKKVTRRPGNAKN
ncbi:MAG: phosphoribosyl-ATP diphosphatase [bacterium]|nr:phosphoribosyl-ATP diphosphatase [bacterium]